MFLYIKTNILRGYGIFKNDFAHPREPATVVLKVEVLNVSSHAAAIQFMCAL